MSLKLRRWTLTTSCPNFCPRASSKSHEFLPQRKASVRGTSTTPCLNSCPPASSKYHQMTALVSWTGNGRTGFMLLINHWINPVTNFSNSEVFLGTIHFQYWSISCRQIRGKGPWPPGLFQDKDEAVSKVWTRGWSSHFWASRCFDDFIFSRPPPIHRRYETIIRELYVGTQCSKCTMRFKQWDQCKSHMDSHKKQSDSTPSKAIPHSWYSRIDVSPNTHQTEPKVLLEKWIMSLMEAPELFLKIGTNSCLCNKEHVLLSKLWLCLCVSIRTGSSTTSKSRLKKQYQVETQKNQIAAEMKIQHASRRGSSPSFNSRQHDEDDSAAQTITPAELQQLQGTGHSREWDIMDAFRTIQNK